MLSLRRWVIGALQRLAEVRWTAGPTGNIDLVRQLLLILIYNIQTITQRRHAVLVLDRAPVDQDVEEILHRLDAVAVPRIDGTLDDAENPRQRQRVLS